MNTPNTTRNLTCIVCPRGCSLTVRFDGEGRIAAITGNTCKRGATYAENECTHPMRTVTSTVRCADGEVVPVKTADVVPKEKMFEVMDALCTVVAPATVRIGQVILADVAGTGVAVVATANKG